MGNIGHREIKTALKALGITDGDTLLVHSSLKNCGYIDGGADTVIDTLLDTLGCTGTLVMPTLSQVDFVNAYRDWNIDRPSDTGLITEVFRKRPQSVRSDQATHSVTAQGANAGWLVRDHGKYGKRQGIFGDTPFAVCSPWQKLYDLNAKILLFGVDMRSNTVKHLAEYIMVNEALDRIYDDRKRLELSARLKTFTTYDSPDKVWPVFNGLRMQELLDSEGYIRKAQLGSGTLMCYRAADTNDFSTRVVLDDVRDWLKPERALWFEDAGA